MWIRLAGAGVAALMIAYWLGVMLSGWRDIGRFQAVLALLLVLIGIAVLSAIALRRPDRAVRIGAIALGVHAAVGPLLLNEWIRGADHFDRYVWIINQGYPCITMGGGPGFLWVTATSWLFALGALAFGSIGSAAKTRWQGLALGAALIALTALAMFPNPEIFATILGCR